MFRRMDKRLFTILMIVTVQMIGASMVLPILPNYARNTFGVDDSVVTLLITVFYLAQFIAGPIIGRMSDLHGRIPLLLLSQVGTVISFVMIGAAESILVLFIARTLEGITGGNIVVAQAYITDVTPKEKRTQALGYVFMAFGTGFVVGPALGSLLSSMFGPQIPFYIGAGAAILTTVMTWFTLTETLTPEQRLANQQSKATNLKPAQIIRNQPLVLVLVIAFVAQFGFSLLQSTFSLFGEDVLMAGYPPESVTLGVGLIFSVLGIGQVITQVFILPRLLRRYDEYPITIIGAVVRAIGTAGLVVALGPVVGAIGGFLFAMGSGTMMPSLQSLASKTVPDNMRGSVLGIYQSINSLSIIFGSALAGSLYAIRPQTPYYLSIALYLLTIIPAVYLMRHHEPATPVEVSP
jgi:DHA1 family tetracycline resistance protein-like MFS transporter